MRPASIPCQRSATPIPGFILSHFKILESPSFATKDNFCLSSKLISVQLHACRSVYDKWSSSLSLFSLFSRFCPVLTWDKFWRRCVWRVIRFGQNLSSGEKPSALVKCWWLRKICLNKQLFRLWEKAFGGRMDQFVGYFSRMIQLLRVLKIWKSHCTVFPVPRSTENTEKS